MNNFVVLFATCSSLLVSSVASADNLCRSSLLHSDGRAADFQPDEMTSVSSMALAYAVRLCVCDTGCAVECNVFIPDMGANACGISDPDGASTTCDACIVSTCAAEFIACYFDH